MSDGIRKSNKILALRKLNNDYNLNLKGIENMSTNQLRKTIFKIRIEKGLSINKLSTYQKSKNIEQGKPDSILVAKIAKKKKYPRRMSFEEVVM